MAKQKTNTKQINTLTDWDWTTLVAAWRYYEHGHTIVSATFPADIVSRYWGSGNPYTDNVRTRIAQQFAMTDHGLRGEVDWTMWLKDHRDVKSDCDCATWTTFYQFCRGWVVGYKVLKVSDGKRIETIKAFYTDYTKRWTPVDGYIAHPLNPPYVPEEYIKKLLGNTQEG